jgi:hypothetical protein
MWFEIYRTKDALNQIAKHSFSNSGIYKVAMVKNPLLPMSL